LLLIAIVICNERSLTEIKFIFIFSFLVTTATSSGLLKVKIFSRMKEKNINSGGSPTKEHPDNLASKSDNSSILQKSDDENFDLLPPGPKTTIFEKSGMKLKIALPPGTSALPASGAVASLSAPTVTITPAVMTSQASSQSMLSDQKMANQASHKNKNSNKVGYSIRYKLFPPF
jgi:hypothetical protein